MDKIIVKPAEGKVAYNCDANRWIEGETEVLKTACITKMLKKGELEVVKPKPKTVTKQIKPKK